MVNASVIHHVTIHNNDGQMVDYTDYICNAEGLIIFPEILRSMADFTLVSEGIEVWIYDNSGTFDRELAVRFAKYIKSKGV